MSEQQNRLGCLRDPLWQFVGVILAIIAIGISLILTFWERPVKRLQVITLSNTSLVNIRPEIVQDIDILYRGNTVENVFFYDFRIENAGNQPILPSDFIAPLLFTFEDIEVVDVVTLESNPRDLEPAFHYASSTEADTLVATVTIEPTLLNPGDSFSSRLIMVGESDVQPPISLSLSSRIVGVEATELQSLNSVLESEIESVPIDRFILSLAGASVLLFFLIFDILAERLGLGISLSEGYYLFKILLLFFISLGLLLIVLPVVLTS